MNAEHVQQRLRRLAEGFFYEEEPIHSLLTERPSNGTLRVSELMKKALGSGGYMTRMPPMALYCPSLDSDASNL
jgi:hypothetical protein